MHVVEEYYGGSEFATTVWLSRAADKALMKFVRKGAREAAMLLEKVEHWAKAGFANVEGGKGCPIRHEWAGVYRIGRTSSLFRLIGFYENDNKASFVIIDVLHKRGTQQTKGEIARINVVAQVKREGLWRKA